MEFQEYLLTFSFKNGEQARKVASLRPTLYIGLGGFGCTVIRKVKNKIRELIEKYMDGFAFLGLDTHPQPLNDSLTLNEYVPLSIGINPNDAAKADPKFLGWYREMVGSWRARNIQTGADRSKVVGRLAFRQSATFQDFIEKLAIATERLSTFQQQFSRGIPLKIYIISTLAGGTGSGCLLDVLLVVGQFFRDRIGGDFPYQAILVTPEVFFGEVPHGRMEELYANTYATLKELHSCLASTPNLFIDYDEARFQRVCLESDLLPDPLHLVGNRNEVGTVVVTKIEELADIIVSYLVLEIQTPMEDQSGQPKVQDKENTYYDSAGKDGIPRAFSSFGVVQTGIPIDILEKLFSLRLIRLALSEELKEPTDIFDQVYNWVDSHNLKESGEDQLQDKIKKEVGRDFLNVSLDAKGVILQEGFKYDKIVAKCQQYKRDMFKSLEIEKKKIIDEKGETIINQLIQDVQETLENLLREKNLGTLNLFLQKLEESLKNHRDALKLEISDCHGILLKLEKEVDLSIQGVEGAIIGFWGRKRRVGDAISDFEARLESLLNQQINLWVKEKSDEIYSKLLEKCKELRMKYSPIVETLKGRLKLIEIQEIEQNRLLDQVADIGRRGPGNRFSLVDSLKAAELYEELLKPDEISSIGRLRGIWLGNSYLLDTKLNFEDWLNLVLPNTINIEVKPKLSVLNFTSIFERFYKNESDKRKIFQDLQNLSSPLFWIDQVRKEPNYDSYWIIAAHPSQHMDFIEKYERYLPGQGKIYAYLNSPYEIILFQLKFGYTIHSYHELKAYEMDYNRLLQRYRQGKIEKRPVRPIHCWPEAEEWEDLIPSRETEEAAKWFILGRAFNYLFPSSGTSSPNDRRNTAFLFARGSNYYLEIPEGSKQQLIGKGLIVAFRNFSERIDWQQLLQKKIENKIAEVGEQTIWQRMNQEYLPLLKEEIERASSNPDPQERQRADILRKLKGALETFMREDLRVSKI